VHDDYLGNVEEQKEDKCHQIGETITHNEEFTEKAYYTNDCRLPTLSGE